MCKAPKRGAYFFPRVPNFLAHLCVCTMGSCASYSVCLSRCLWFDQNPSGHGPDHLKPPIHLWPDKLTTIRQIHMTSQQENFLSMGALIGRWAHFCVKLHFFHKRRVLTLRRGAQVSKFPGNTTTVKKRISNVSERLDFSLKCRIF